MANEKPILFSGERVRAILEGRKTQTRRVLHPQPFLERKQDASWWLLDRSRSGYGNQAGSSAWKDGDQPYILHWPYGQPGDRLWVRETWAYGCHEDSGEKVAVYRADMNPGDEIPSDVARGISAAFRYNRWRPSIHMPRWASRITLEITKVRVERVNVISEADATAEGILCDTGLECSECDWQGWEDSVGVKQTDDEDWEFLCPRCGEVCAHHPLDEQSRCEYRKLWDKLNAKRGFGWDKNPWVWVIEFKTC